MIKIRFPAKDFSVKAIEGKDWIFDKFRKQWVRLTPEEWVRQNMLQYLTDVMNYPGSMIAIEKEIKLGELKKRFDILVYRTSTPWMLIECKEMNVPLTEATLQQVLRYHTTLQPEFLVITNGNQTIGYTSRLGQLIEIDSLPQY